MQSRLAVVGDLHDHWSEFDLESLNQSDYRLILFVGDLGRGEATSQRIARSIAQLERPALVMPGNADAPYALELGAEFALRRGLGQLFGGAEDAVGAESLGSGVALCGYSLHRLRLAGLDFTIVAGRPYSMGGPGLTFEPQLHRSFGVASLADSTKRLVDLVDGAETEALLFLSHNGPSGLGQRATDLWGCDFRPEEGDWGDPDLEVAIAHARASGRCVLGVVAGHMHLRVRGREQEREWMRRVGDTLYVNAARVPRIERRRGGATHHHVALAFDASGMRAEEVYLKESTV